MITLEKWYVVYDGIGYTANGIVYGHTSPHCPDGTEIHTSLIEGAEISDGELILSTLNSEYHVTIDEMDRECFDPWRSLRMFEKFANKFGIEECLSDVRKKYLELEKEQLDMRAEISSKIKDNSLYLEFSDDQEFYFNRGLFRSSGGTVEFIPRISDFDTEHGKLIAVINHIVEYCPYNGGNIEFLWHSETSLSNGEYLGVICNSGKTALNIRFSWGKTVIVSPGSELEITSGMGVFLPLTSNEQDF